MNYTDISIGISAAILSGVGSTLVANFRDNKRERVRQTEREQDHLKLELKDLKIQLYQLEKDLTDWKDRYYSTVQELISVKLELEETLIKLSLIDMDIRPEDC